MLRRRPSPILTNDSEPEPEPVPESDLELTPNVPQLQYYGDTYSPRNIYSIKKIRLLKGIFAVVLITVIVTLFELIFYIYVVNPTVISAVKELLSSEQNVENIQEILMILKKKEDRLINEINIGSYYVIISEICLMVGILFYIYIKISYISVVYARRLETWSEGLDNEIHFANFKDIIIISLSTIVLLVCFQIVFYFFGTNYRYLGYYGTDEALYQFLSNYKATE